MENENESRNETTPSPDPEPIPVSRAVEDYGRLQDVLKEFSQHMSDRLSEKIMEGRFGWNSPMYDVRWDIRRVASMLNSIDDGTHDEQTRKHCVDLANYAMFLWQRTFDQPGLPK